MCWSSLGALDLECSDLPWLRATRSGVIHTSTSRSIAAAVLQKLQQQFPDQLTDAALLGFGDRLPQNVDQCSSTFLTNLVANHGPVDLLGAS